MRNRLVAAVLALLAGAGTGLAAEKRVALIIGNAHYHNGVMSLANTANDARAMDRALRDVGFETTLKLDATRKELYLAIREFADRIATGSAIGLFYYAGHGVQAGDNYLIPVDADLASDAELESDAVDIHALLKAMSEAHNPMNIVILDACRDNPLPRHTRSGARGLARIDDAPQSTLIAYSAAPGQTAEDGPAGSNGAFTGELVKALAEPGLTLEGVFKKVTIAVAAKTGNRQQPWTESSVQIEFYFRPPTPPSAAAPGDKAVELEFWKAIANSTDPRDFAYYLKRYPQGEFASLAERKAAALKAAKPAQQEAMVVPKPPAEGPGRPRLMPSAGERPPETDGGPLALAVVPLPNDPQVSRRSDPLPLDAPAVRHDARAAATLVDAGANVDRENHQHNTALNLAVNRNDVAEARILLELGADAMHRDSRGWFPLRSALKHENADMVRFLMAAGADAMPLFGSSFRKDLEAERNPAIRRDLDDALGARYRVLEVIQPLMEKQGGDRADLLRLVRDRPFGLEDITPLLESAAQSPDRALQGMVLLFAAMSDARIPMPTAALDREAAGAAAYAKAETRSAMPAAAAEYEEAVRLAPWVAAYHRNLCTIYRLAAAYGRARARCFSYLQSAPDDAEVSRRMEEIARELATIQSPR